MSILAVLRLLVAISELETKATRVLMVCVLTELLVARRLVRCSAAPVPNVGSGVVLQRVLMTSRRTAPDLTLRMFRCMM